MQLNDILEENSLKAISTKTKISEENLEKLFAKEFEKLKRVKAMGFISIIEREYQADLGSLRQEAHAYYAQQSEDKSVTLGVPIVEEKKGTSKFLVLIVLLLIAAASWYFFTQFDKKNLQSLISFVDDATVEHTLEDGLNNQDDVERLSIGKVIEEQEHKELIKEADEHIAKEEGSKDQSVVITQSVTDITPATEVIEQDRVQREKTLRQTVVLVPVKRLWFGLVDMESQEREHFSIAQRYELDISTKRWLVATSSAPFSIENANEVTEFNDAKEHYFKIDKEGVTPLSKSEYVSLGGWSQW